MVSRTCQVNKRFIEAASMWAKFLLKPEVPVGVVCEYSSKLPRQGPAMVLLEEVLPYHFPDMMV